MLKKIKDKIIHKLGGVTAFEYITKPIPVAKQEEHRIQKYIARFDIRMHEPTEEELIHILGIQLAKTIATNKMFIVRKISFNPAIHDVPFPDYYEATIQVVDPRGK